MLLRQRWKPLQNGLRNEWRHLLDLREVVGILNAMNDEVVALREDRLRELARSLRSHNQESPVFPALFGNPLKGYAGIDGKAARAFRDVAVRLFKDQMDRHLISGRGAAHPVEDQPCNNCGSKFDDFIRSIVQVDDTKLTLFPIV